MKPQNLFLLFALLLISFISHGQTDAVDYLSAIGTEYQNISKETMSYVSAINHGKSARKVEKRRIELLAQIKESERSVRKMKPFQSDSRLRDSVAAYFKMNTIIINEDYGKLVDLEDIAEQSYDAMEAYLLAKEKAGEKIDKAFEAASTQYELFAKNNNINLVNNESKLGSKLKQVKQVNEYHTQIYLIFFKSCKNEAYLLDAISNHNVNAIEQTRNALLTSSTNDIEKLKKIGGFTSDQTLKTACNQALNFYKTEASTHIPRIIDFQLKKDNFEKMQKMLNAKKPNDRTQIEIDNYNKAVEEYNKAIKDIIKLEEGVFKKRSAMLKIWNDTSETFLNEHTP